MKKIIIKSKVRNRDEFEQKLSNMGMDFGPMYWQHDRIYVPRGYNRRSNLPRLILRTEMRSVDRPAKYSILLKRHIEDSGIDIVDIVQIREYTEMANIILQLGFEQRAEVSRRRQELTLGVDTKLYLDNIDRINGSYVKIETELNRDEKVGEERESLMKTLLVMGQDKGTIVAETYFELLERK